MQGNDGYLYLLDQQTRYIWKKVQYCKMRSGKYFTISECMMVTVVNHRANRSYQCCVAHHLKERSSCATHLIHPWLERAINRAITWLDVARKVHFVPFRYIAGTL